MLYLLAALAGAAMASRNAVNLLCISETSGLCDQLNQLQAAEGDMSVVSASNNIQLVFGGDDGEMTQCESVAHVVGISMVSMRSVKSYLPLRASTQEGMLCMDRMNRLGSPFGPCQVQIPPMRSFQPWLRFAPGLEAAER